MSWTKAAFEALALMLVFGAGVASAVDGARTGISAEEAVAGQVEAGKRLYEHTCIHCHGPGFWGTNRLAKRIDKEHALLENRTDLSAGAIQAIVRNGIGSMPPLRKTELSDEQVAAIAAYLTRNNR
jgi:mono/diheme cytochrome c family protein